MVQSVLRHSIINFLNQCWTGLELETLDQYLATNQWTLHVPKKYWKFWHQTQRIGFTRYIPSQFVSRMFYWNLQGWWISDQTKPVKRIFLLNNLKIYFILTAEYCPFHVWVYCISSLLTLISQYNLFSSMAPFHRKNLRGSRVSLHYDRVSLHYSRMSLQGFKNGSMLSLTGHRVSF